MIDKRKVRVDIGFWNTHGIYIPDIQEVSEVEMEQERDENLDYERMREDGYKSLSDKIWQESFKKASMDYERKLNNPYDYM